jgi:hypothetical protein
MTSTPRKTKHFDIFLVSYKFMFYDSPSLVFSIFLSFGLEMVVVVHYDCCPLP